MFPKKKRLKSCENKTRRSKSSNNAIEFLRLVAFSKEELFPFAWTRLNLFLNDLGYGTRSIGRLIWPQWNQPRPFPSGSQYKGFGTIRKSDFRLAISATSHTIDWWHNSKVPFKTIPLLSRMAHTIIQRYLFAAFCFLDTRYLVNTEFFFSQILFATTHMSFVSSRKFNVKSARFIISKWKCGLNISYM